MFITVFLVVIIAINYFGIRFFGEFEFWLSSFKVVVIVGLIILSLVLALGGGPDHDRKGFRYWKKPGAFREYIDSVYSLHNPTHTRRHANSNPREQPVVLESSMASGVQSLLQFSRSKFKSPLPDSALPPIISTARANLRSGSLGTELVGVTVGEAQNPRKTIPRAIRLTFYRILFFYILSVLLVGLNVPYDSPELAFANKQGSRASASPFVVSIKLAGISFLPGLINACILIFVFSASNSDLYIATRTIYGLAMDGKAPRIFCRTDRRGVPVCALFLCSLFSLLAYMNVSNDAKTVFNYL